jgi:hypothetical protein
MRGARLAAPLLKRLHLELGGNSALVVLEDANLEHAARVGSFGSFHNAGQVCMAVSRHLVAARLVENIRRCSPNGPKGSRSATRPTGMSLTDRLSTRPLATRFTP